MASTVNLKLVNLESNQFNPENTYNSNLEVLDIIVQLNSISNTLTTPPSAVNGDIYIVGSGATGDWATKDKQIAYYYNGWKFIEPKRGWRVYNNSTDKYLYWNSTNWTDMPLASSFSTTNFEILDSVDASSKVKFNLDNVPTSTTVTIQVPNSDYILCKQNLVATSMPTSSNDSTQGYSVGSLWINNSTDKGYICVDSSSGASVWKEVASATGAGDVLGPVTSTINEIASFNDTTGDTIKGSGILITSNKELYPYFKVISNKSTSYTITSNDSGTVLVVNSSSSTIITLPQTSTETIALGFNCRIIRRGTGAVSFAVQGTDTVESKSNYINISDRYGEVTVTKIINGTPNTWHLCGDLS